MRSALGANAGFSAIAGIAALALGGRLEASLGPPAWSLRALGAGLIMFGLVVAREAGAPSRPGTWRIIGADLAWVAAAVIIIAIPPGWLAETGRAVLASLTVVVAALAAAQWRGVEAAS